MTKLLMTSLVALLSLPAWAECRTHDEWPDLSAWSCGIENELIRRDAGTGLDRQLFLITDLDVIRDLRRELSRSDLEECRKYAVSDYEIPLTRIQQHQGLPSMMFAERRSFAAAEIWNTSNEGPLTACELQVLSEDADTRKYLQYYYLKFGAIRQGKHLIIKVESRW